MFNKVKQTILLSKPVSVLDSHQDCEYTVRVFAGEVGRQFFNGFRFRIDISLHWETAFLGGRRF